MLASPWPINSWLGSTRCLALPAMALAMEIDSMKATRAMTRAALISWSTAIKTEGG